MRRRREPVVARLEVDGREVDRVELATSNAERRRGLLRRDGLDGGLWLEPCHQVHTFRMRFAIEAAYVDRRGRVLAVRSMPPGSMGPLRWRARAVLEAEANVFAQWGLREGSTVRVVHEDGGAGQPMHSGRP